MKKNSTLPVSKINSSEQKNSNKEGHDNNNNNNNNDNNKGKKDDNYSTYLGEKGYSIFKECLSVEEQHFIRTELTVKPFIPKSPIQPNPFPIYLESPLKLYMPRYFGIDTYGPPDRILISPGKNIS